MNVGIVGLGLIGGSFAKAYSESGHAVFGLDTDNSTLSFARLSGAVAQELDKSNISDCDLILICIYPQAAIAFMRAMGQYIGKKPVVIDCCGTKRVIVEHGMELARQYGFTYLGGHPMAGTQYSGFKYSKPTLFYNAPMVIVPPDFDDIALLSRVKELLAPAGFGRISVTTAEKHDEMIAFTSQLAHVVSSAYIKSPTALQHRGFSAGSYRDMTRVAWLNPEMWAELFLDDRDYLIRELDILSENLGAYREALENNDRETLVRLLAEGKARKEEVDGR
ncbi:MAG: prephenate dehydrogenase [Oscillospiraceae bacterium]|nr:prephenate dehydrogenase [Oscillospiraceae bacterium]